MPAMTSAQRERMIADLRVAVSDAEELLKLTADEAGDAAAGLRERLQDRLDKARHHLLALPAAVADNARVAGRAADTYVQDHPWQSAALGAAFGAGVGLLVGLLIGRR